MKARTLLLICALAVVLLALPAAGVAPIAGAANDPQSNFRAEPRLGEVPLTVSFTDTSTGNEMPLTFHWIFGDGQESFEENPTHTYQAPGAFEPTLIVTDRLGRTSQKSTNITVDGPTLFAALLPVSRSVLVGQPATVFLSVINAGHITARAVSVKLDPASGPGGGPVPANLMFVATDPATNLVTGVPNALLDIPAGQRQSYLIAVTPTAPLPPTDVRFIIGGTNSTRGASQVSGLNTLLLSASGSPTPDIVAAAVTPTGDGILTLPGTSGSNAFAVASANVGAAGGSISVSADTGAAALPVSIRVCQTDPASGVCASSPAPSVVTRIDPGATPTFAVFVTAAGAVPFNPEVSRIFVRFTDAGGAPRGATSVAVKAP